MGKINRSCGYKTFYMFKLTEYDILMAHKTKNTKKIQTSFFLKISDGVLILLISVEMPTEFAISTVVNRIKFMLS